jgi:AraC family transcriptional regulator
MYSLPRGFTAGEPRRWRRVGGLVLAEVEYRPQQRVCESHGSARFMLVLRGGFGPGPEGRAGALLFAAGPDQPVLIASAAGARCLIVEMGEDWLARVRQGAPVPARSTWFRSGLITHLAHRLYGEFHLRDEVSRLAIESLALGVLAEASRRAWRETGAAAPEWLQRARAFIDEHFAEHLSLVMVAALAGVHPVHLARTFRRAYDTTFSSYLRSVRLDFAREQLATTSVPLAAIAAAAGFCDQSHFSRLFRRDTGLTPAAYRTEIRSGLIFRES